VKTTLILSHLQAVAVTADRLVEAMDGISTTISKEWVGLILLPAVSSVAGLYVLSNSHYQADNLISFQNVSLPSTSPSKTS